MASTMQASQLFKTLGARIADAHNAAKAVEINTGGGVDLPGGINSGVAQLTVLEFIEGKKEEDKGKWYFRAAAVMKEPEYHDNIKVRGKQTSVLIPFFDTPTRQNKKSFVEHHWVDYRDLFAKLGVNPPPEQQSGESKDAASARISSYYQGATQILLESAEKGKPVYFGVRTWQPLKATTGKYAGKDSRVQEMWGERVEYAERGAAANPAAGVTAAPSANGTHQPTPPAPPAAMKPETFNEFQAPAASPPAPAQAPAAAPTGPIPDADLDALAEAADADPDGVTDDGLDAKKRISAECSRVGVTAQEAEAAPDWAGLVALVRSRRAAPHAQPAPAAAAPALGAPRPDPVKGQTVAWNGQPGYEITSSNPDGRTVTLKGPDKKSVMGPDKKLLKVPFDQVS